MSTTSSAAPGLSGVEACVFDVFGTVVDWLGSVSSGLARVAGDESKLKDEDWIAFAKEWRIGYHNYTRRVAAGGEGSSNADIMFREILDAQLATPQWKHLESGWDDTKRHKLVQLWHHIEGWPDASAGLYDLKKKVIIGTLSNGSVRLLVDMAKHADLPWDVVFGGQLLGSYKPNPKMYLGAVDNLSLTPEKVCMVAAHIEDLRAAASYGLKTIYVRRPTEDDPNIRVQVKAKDEGGEVDAVVDSFEQLASLF